MLGMMARRGVIGFLGGGMTLMLTGCGMLGGTKSYRFRMTVEIETPQGLKIGSSVMEITSYKTMKLTSEEHAGAGSFRGEAVVVDLPNGPVFALLKNDDAGQPLDVRVTSALSRVAEFNTVDDYVATVADLSGMFSSAKAELPRADWPLMVRFRDIDDPRSVEKVSPQSMGVKRILVETTGDQITTGINKRFSWFAQYLNRHLDGTSASIEDMTTDNIASHMSARSFSTENYK